MTTIVERGAGALCARISRVVDSVEIADDLSGALVGDREVRPRTPGDLTGALASHLYEFFHSARPQSQSPGPRGFRDRAFEERLAAGTPHRTTNASVRVVGPVETDRFVADVDGLRVWLPITAIDGPTAVVDLPSMRPGLSPGYFLANSSREWRPGRPLLRVYVHLRDGDAAAAIWSAVLTALEKSKVRYRAKVSSSARLYPRRDALVVYLHGEHTTTGLDTVAAAVAGRAGVGDTTSPYTFEVAPGVSVAFDPDDGRPGRTQVSFGEHRSLAIADGLVAHARRPEGSRAAAVAEALRAANVDAGEPARNLDSPALPHLTSAG